MRKDFGRLVIERERRGSSAKNLKMRKTGRFRLESPDWEEWDYDGPLRVRTQGLGGIKRAYDPRLAEKSFSDVLTPVRGYLRKAVGRRWNDVFSELTAALGRGTYPIRHVLTVHTSARLQPTRTARTAGSIRSRSSTITPITSSTLATGRCGSGLQDALIDRPGRKDPETARVVTQ